LFLACFFFLASSSFNYLTQEYAKSEKDIDFVKWVSPDETANYIFTKLYAQTGDIGFYEKYNLYVKDIMHPRSIRSDHGNLKPTSFLGIILVYGKIASFFGYEIIPYLTPLLASIGLIFFYLFLKEIFDEDNALISTIILACFPVYLYYSSRSMFHNIPLTVFFVVSLYFITQTIKKRKFVKNDYCGWVFASLAGFFCGLALITRASEIWWISLVIFLIWIFFIKRIGITKFILFASFCFSALLPMFYYNTILYGAPFLGGYTEMNQSIIEISQASLNIVNISNKEASPFKDFFETLKHNIFYFGFHPDFSYIMFKKYFVHMFSYIFIPFCLGMFLFLLKIKLWRKKHWLYFLSYFSLSVILVIYYGSWEFHDNPDPNSFTIGNSYTRYWLPVYLGGLPMVTYAITKSSEYIYSLLKFLKNKFCLLFKIKIVKKNGFFSFSLRKDVFKFSLVVLLIFLIFLTSFNYFLFGSEEGIVYTIEKQKIIKEEWKKVIDLTPHNAVLITRYHDKIFFPERKVIMGEFNDVAMVEEYSNITKKLPVYYYNFILPKDALAWLNSSRLANSGLKIEEVSKINKDFGLYKLELVK